MEFQKQIILNSIESYKRAIINYSKCKQDARDMHSMAAGQIFLARLLGLITDEEKENLLQQISNTYGDTLSKLYA